MTDRELIEMAIAASENAYAPYSNYKVGAAVECASGAVYKGCNVENAAFGGTICAERNAYTTAVANGERKFNRIAVYANGEDYCVPCGQCRQFMAEFGLDTLVLCVRGDGEYEAHPLREMLPFAFSKEYL